MSLTAAMNSAMSGLSAVSRATELVASNIANATTPGYGKRTLALSSAGAGLSGVRTDGIRRHADPVLAAQRRTADADLAQADVRTDYLDTVGRIIGLPGESNGLSARVADFEASLISASGRPDLAGRLDDAVLQAAELARHLRDASAAVQAQRQRADTAIRGMVDELNANLGRLQDINSGITAALSSNADASGLRDQRAQIIDAINRVVPVTVADRPHGQIAIYTRGGAILLDGTAADLSFAETNGIRARLTLEDGDLGGLTLNGLDLRTDSATGALRGGALGAQFALRDEWAIESQTQLDALARDLIERFEDPAVDSTRAAGATGLFTDDGLTLDPTLIPGLAERIALNAAVDPAQGGGSWRLRDGLGAAAAGTPGNASLINTLTDALTTRRSLAGAVLGSGTHSAQTAASEVVTRHQYAQALAQDDQSYANAVQYELAQLELAQGVDTDAELQSLMTLEQSYTANAKVLETIDFLLAEILRI